MLGILTSDKMYSVRVERKQTGNRGVKCFTDGGEEEKGWRCRRVKGWKQEVDKEAAEAAGG